MKVVDKIIVLKNCRIYAKQTEDTIGLSMRMAEFWETKGHVLVRAKSTAGGVGYSGIVHIVSACVMTQPIQTDISIYV